MVRCFFFQFILLTKKNLNLINVDCLYKIVRKLIAGFLGSMYSFLQFLGMPIVGALSDVYGRKPMMLLCLVGIALSYLLWAISYNFAVFVLARFLGGISKGNISLSMAIISDVTSLKTRGKSMVGMSCTFNFRIKINGFFKFSKLFSVSFFFLIMLVSW